MVDSVDIESKNQLLSAGQMEKDNVTIEEPLTAGSVHEAPAC